MPSHRSSSVTARRAILHRATKRQTCSHVMGRCAAGLFVLAAGLSCKASSPIDGTVHPAAQHLDRSIQPTGRIRLGSLPRGDWANPLATLHLVTSIGQLSGPQDHVFGEITSAAVDIQGRVVVLDRKMNEIKVFRGDSLVQTVGRAGAGPGEFQSPVGLALDPDGVIFAADRRHIHLFRPFNDEYRFERALLITDLHPLSLCLLEGAAYFSGISAPENYAVYRIGAQDGHTSRFGSVYSSTNPLINMKMADGVLGCDPSRKLIIHAAAALGEIRAYDTSGTLRWLTVIDDYRPLRVVEGRDGSSRYLDPEGVYDLVKSIVALRNGIAVYVTRLRPGASLQEVDTIYALILDPTTGQLMQGGIVGTTTIFANTANFVTATDTPVPSVALWKLP